MWSKKSTPAAKAAAPRAAASRGRSSFTRSVPKTCPTARCTAGIILLPPTIRTALTCSSSYPRSRAAEVGAGLAEDPAAVAAEAAGVAGGAGGAGGRGAVVAGGAGAFVIFNQDHRDVEGAAAEVEDEVDVSAPDVGAVAECGGGGLVDEPESADAGARRHAGEPVLVVFVGFDGDSEDHLLLPQVQLSPSGGQNCGE